MTFSVNNRLILEEYVKKGLEAQIQGGIATPGQRNGLRGLAVLMDTTDPHGRPISKGSTAYIREEILYNASNTWAKPLTCPTLPGKFIIAEHQYIEFIDDSTANPKESA